MRCERYWREGVLLVEQGRPDLHRDGCLDCRRAHEARGELVRAFRFVGAGGGDPRWQTRVWRQLAEVEASRRAWFERPWVAWASAFAAAGALVLFLSTQGLLRRGGIGAEHDDRQPSFEIIPAKITRSTSAGIEDRVRIWVRATQEARIYRAEKLLLRCSAALIATPGCASVDGGVMAEHEFRLPGEYQLVIVPEPEVHGASAVAEPAGSLDRDLARITAGGSTYQLHELSVR